MNCWLMKSDVDDFDIDDLKKKKREPWTGVRNFQARNFLKAMKPGDLALFHHSGGNPPCAAGVCKVASEPYPDPTQFDKKSKYYDSKATKEKPYWYLVDVVFVSKFKHFVSIEKMRQEPILKGMWTLRPGSRLSVTPLTKQEFETIVKMGEKE
ncbi:EVE domain-containing protein [Candidatus Parcubacteria bacterium]|nr:EVE domain-containing protein [Candidatus Parcubacteria bacterium]